MADEIEIELNEMSELEENLAVLDQADTSTGEGVLFPSLSGFAAG